MWNIFVFVIMSLIFIKFYIISIIFSNIVLIIYTVSNYKKIINFKNIPIIDLICIIFLYLSITLCFGFNLFYCIIWIRKILKK